MNNKQAAEIQKDAPAVQCCHCGKITCICVTTSTSSSTFSRKPLTGSDPANQHLDTYKEGQAAYQAGLKQAAEAMKEACALRLEAAATDNEEMLDPHPINFQYADAYREGAKLIRALNVEDVLK